MAADSKNTQQSRGIQRILVALDASSASLSALQNAVELAAGLEAELIGLYVEDHNLLRLAQLPLAREVTAFSPALRRIQSVEIERQLRAQAAELRRVVSRICGERNVAWQFRVSRGAVAAELLAAAVDADLMVIGKIGRSFPGTRRTGSIARAIAARRPGMTLVFQSGGRLTVPVIRLYDGSRHSAKAVETAGILTRIHDGKLTVLVVAESGEEARRLQLEVINRLADHKLGADFRLLVGRSITGIAQRIHMEGFGPVVIPCDAEEDGGEALCALLDEITNPVLLVR